MENKNLKEKNYLENDIIVVSSKTIGCDGGIDYGHPLVYLNLDKGETICPYCSIKYIFKKKK